MPSYVLFAFYKVSESDSDSARANQQNRKRKRLRLHGAMITTNNKGGRKPSNEFLHTKNVDGVFTCNYCKSVVSGRPLRIRAHLEKCPKYPRWKDDIDIPEVIEESESILLSSPNTPTSSTPKARGERQSFFQIVSRKKIDTKAKTRLDKVVAQFFYAANVAFRQVEGESFKILVKELQEVSGYVPPSRDHLSGRLLDDVYADCEQNMAEAIKKEEQQKEKAIVLCQDGWSSSLNRPITATSICIGNEAQLLSAEEATGSEKKTSQYCADITIKEIENIKTKFGKDVFAICSDNEAKMKKMRELVKKAKPGVLTYGCSAHYLNLVEQAVTPTTAIEHIKKVCYLV